MKVKAKINVDVPMGLFCKSCLRKERDEKHQMFCTLFNKFIYVRKGERARNYRPKNCTKFFQKYIPKKQLTSLWISW